MEELTKLIKEINRLSENTSPVIHDLAQQALHNLRKNQYLTMKEVLSILDRKEGLELEED